MRRLPQGCSAPGDPREGVGWPHGAQQGSCPGSPEGAVRPQLPPLPRPVCGLMQMLTGLRGSSPGPAVGCLMCEAGQPPWAEVCLPASWRTGQLLIAETRGQLGKELGSAITGEVSSRCWLTCFAAQHHHALTV